jgi:ribose transport system substrate-binding protein
MKKYLISLILMFSGATASFSGVEEAKALIAQYSKLPTFEAPGPAFDAKSCMKGKRMFVIPLTSSNPFNQMISQGFVDAAEMVGFDLRAWETQLDPAGWIQGISTAVAEGYDLIDLQGGIPPEFLAPQIAEARAKGVKVTATHFYDHTTQPIPDIIDSAANSDYVIVGKLMAAWSIMKTNGNVNALVIGSDEIGPTAPLVGAIMDYFKANCDNCKTSYANVPVNDWATKLQSTVQNAVLADPSINYILPIYDSMSGFAAPGLQIAGSKAKIASYNGTPFVLDMMRDGDIVEMNVGESLGWVGMAATDANMRLLCGEKPVTLLNTPAYIFSDENVKTAGVPATFNDGYGDVHIKEFRKLWQLD